MPICMHAYLHEDSVGALSRLGIDNPDGANARRHPPPPLLAQIFPRMSGVSIRMDVMVNARFQCIIAAGIVTVGLQRATQSQEMQQQHDRSI